MRRSRALSIGVLVGVAVLGAAALWLDRGAGGGAVDPLAPGSPGSPGSAGHGVETPTSGETDLADGGREDARVDEQPLVPDGARPELPDRRYVRLVDALERPFGGVLVSVGPLQKLKLALRRGPLRTSRPPARADVASDADGIVELRRERAGLFAVAWGDSVVPVVFPVDGSGRTRDTATEVRMAGSATVEAFVTQASGDPLGGVGVTLHFDGRALERPAGSVDLPRLGWRETTGDDGRATVAGLPTGIELTVRFELAGKAPTTLPGTLVLEPGEVRPLSWAEGTGATLHGTLATETGALVGDYTIWLLPAPEERDGLLDVTRRPMRTTRTDAAGVFAFEALPSGGWWVGPSPSATSPWESAPPDRPVASVARFVRIAPGEESVHVALVAHADLSIEGRAVDADGAPVPGARIFARAAGEDAGMQAEADDAGAFRLAPIAPGEWSLRAAASASARGPDPSAAATTARSGDRDVRVVVPRTWELVVELVDEAGEPALASELALFHGGGGEARRTLGPGQRAFTLKGVLEGEYAILARSRDGRAGLLERFDFRAPDQRARVTVGRAGLLRVRYAGDSEYVWIDVTVAGQKIDGTAVELGAESALELPPGTYRLELLEGGRTSTRDVTLEAGETLDLVIPEKR